MVKVSHEKDVAFRRDMYYVSVDVGVMLHFNGDVPKEEKVLILMQNLLDVVAADAAAELQKTVK